LEEWTEARKAGRWFGVPVPYHQGEMNLAELLAQDDSEHKEADQPLPLEAAAVDDADHPHEPTISDADIAQQVEDVSARKEAEDAQLTGVHPLPEGVEELRPVASERLQRVGVEPVRDDEVEDLQEVERRERLRLWELEQRRRERERQDSRDRADMRTMVDRAMTSIHK
jgi:uncharacterized protein with von Willebrand factor type A (vWA) domain